MNNNFNNMDDLFNQLMGNMGGYRSENRRYMINGRSDTLEEFAIYCQQVNCLVMKVKQSTQLTTR